jgi:hypothetical protein
MLVPTSGRISFRQMVEYVDLVGDGYDALA